MGKERKQRGRMGTEGKERDGEVEGGEGRGNGVEGRRPYRLQF